MIAGIMFGIILYLLLTRTHVFRGLGKMILAFWGFGLTFQIAKSIYEMDWGAIIVIALTLIFVIYLTRRKNKNSIEG